MKGKKQKAILDILSGLYDKFIYSTDFDIYVSIGQRTYCFVTFMTVVINVIREGS